MPMNVDPAAEPRRGVTMRNIAVGLALVALSAGALGVGFLRTRPPEPVAVAPIASAPPLRDASGVIGPAWLARFDQDLAAGTPGRAIRQALSLLGGNLGTPGKPRFAPGIRAALVTRLASSLARLEPALTDEVLAQLLDESLDPASARLVADQLARSNDPAMRLALANRVLSADTPVTTLRHLAEDREPRVRMAAIKAMTRRADAGDAMAAAALTERLQTEPDPRLRQALARETASVPTADGEKPVRPRNSLTDPNADPEGVYLPPAVARAPARDFETVWGQDRNASNQAPTSRSSISIGENGQATVETVYHDSSGDDYHVRYPAWAWRDANNNLIIDARDQPVEYLDGNSAHDWSPDSMHIAPNGTISTIDDWRQSSVGAASLPGSG